MLPRITRVVGGLAMTLVMVGTVPTHADQRVGPPTLDEATFLKRVAERSPRRAVFEDRRRAARAAPAVASVLPNPTLSYEREAVPGLDAHDDFFRIGWTLDLGGRRGLGADAARAGADAETLTVERDAQLLEIEARAAYLDAAYARLVVERLDGSRTALSAMVEALRSRSAQGDASSYDADRAALELDALDDERATAQRMHATVQLRLGALMGEPAVAYEASDSIGMPARPPQVAASPQRLEIAAARARATQADRQIALARRSWVPRLALTAGILASSSMGGDGIGYVVAIGGDLPVFDRGAAAAALGRAEAKRWRSEAQALETEVSAEVAQAHRELVLRIEQATTYASGPALRAADLQQRASVAYREGDRPILELLDVHRTARHVAVRALELVYEARRAELALRRAQGRNP